MSRQRVIKDDFWRSNVTAGLSIEDRYALLYLLTCPSTNVVGVYQIVPAISAAEMGWDSEQLLTVIRRLAQMGLVELDVPTSSIWVRTWWQHNAANGAFTGKVRGKALAEIRTMPRQWIASYVTDLLSKITSDAVDLRSQLVSEFLESDGPSMGHSSVIGGAVGTTTVALSLSPTTTSSEHLTPPKSLTIEDRKEALRITLANLVAPGLAQQVLDELDAAISGGRIRQTWAQYLHGLIQKAKASEFNAGAGRAIAKQRLPPPPLRDRPGLPAQHSVASHEVAREALSTIARELSVREVT